MRRHSQQRVATLWIQGVLAPGGYHVTLHYIINDIFMVFFFGIAAKEVTESCLPGGSLNPPFDQN